MPSRHTRGHNAPHSPRPSTRDLRLQFEEIDLGIKLGQLNLLPRFNSLPDHPPHNDLCQKCGKPGNVVLCELCNIVWHEKCLTAEQREIAAQSDDWICELCQADLEPAYGPYAVYFLTGEPYDLE